MRAAMLVFQFALHAAGLSFLALPDRGRWNRVSHFVLRVQTQQVQRTDHNLVHDNPFPPVVQWTNCS